MIVNRIFFKPGKKNKSRKLIAYSKFPAAMRPAI